MFVLVPVASLCQLQNRETLYDEVVSYLIEQGKQDEVNEHSMKIQCVDAAGNSKRYLLAGKRMTELMDKREWILVDHEDEEFELI